MSQPGAWRWTRWFYVLLYPWAALVWCGLIPEWGTWALPNPTLRRQTEAFLRGELALSHSPADLRHDLAWAEGGVHQVWGLGVPLWQLPFALAARSCGFDAFPEVLAFGAALGVAGWLMQRSCFHFFEAISPRTSAPTEDAKARFSGIALLAVGCVWIFLCFPPFITLLRSRFEVYEEIVAYEYIFGLGLISGLVGLAWRADRWRFWLLCAFAGVGGLVRPTLVLHGCSILTAAIIGSKEASEEKLPPDSSELGTRRHTDRWRRTLFIGLAAFALGGGLLFITNRARFGDGFEFGHKLNLQHFYGSVYATRFDDPFQQEPLPSAARELFGLLFLADASNGTDFYREGMFPGQSSTLRWRELYLRTYDVGYLPWLCLGWSAAVAGFLGILRSGARAGPQAASGIRQLIVMLGIYSLISTVLLSGFYLRNSVIASRYLLDLMPSWAAAVAAAWLTIGNAWIERGWPKWVLGFAAAGLLGWSVGEIWLGSRSGVKPAVVSSLQARRSILPPSIVSLPTGNYSSPQAVDDTNIPFNGAGWNEVSLRASPCVILFVNDPEFLELELASDEEKTIADLEKIRAKVGLEFLERESIRRTARGWLIRFRGARREKNRAGLQTAFVATVPNSELAAAETTWKLLAVRWRPAVAAPEGDR